MHRYVGRCRSTRRFRRTVPKIATPTEEVKEKRRLYLVDPPHPFQAERHRRRSAALRPPTSRCWGSEDDEERRSFGCGRRLRYEDGPRSGPTRELAVRSAPGPIFSKVPACRCRDDATGDDACFLLNRGLSPIRHPAEVPSSRIRPLVRACMMRGSKPAVRCGTLTDTDTFRERSGTYR